MNLTAVKTWSSGETLTAADLNAEFQNVYTHTITNDDIDTTDTYTLGELIIGSGISAADGGQLHVHTASAGTIQASADADEAVVENSAAAGITILSGNTSTGNLHFGDDGDNDIGKIVYDHSANTLTLTAGATAVAALAAGSFVINEGSADIDTRVESNGLSHALYVDGGKDALVIGANSDVSSTDTPFLIDYAARTATAATNFDRAKVAGTNAITIPTGTTALVTGLHVAEPNLTATGTITSAASLYVAAAPTEAGTNYALWVDAGATQLDGATTVGSTLTVGSNLLVSSNDGGAIGASGTAWSDLFLASGAVVNFNAGDVTLTHSSNTLTIAGGTTVVDALTSGGNIISDADSTDDLGTTSVRWANLYVDSIGDTGQALALTAGTNAISLTAGDVTIFDDNNNADTSLSIGTSATEALKVEVLNGAANKTAEEVRFTTSTASATADHGKMSFYVDDAQIATIDDGGIDLAAGLAFTVNGAAVGLTFNNDANNRVVTGDGSGGLNGEADLTFDGTDLAVGNTAPSSYIDSVHGVIVGDTGDATSEIVVATSTSGVGEINFTDTADTTNQGQILYDHTSNFMSFDTAGSEVIRIDSSGRVGLNETSPSTHVAENGLVISSGNTSNYCGLVVNMTGGSSVVGAQINFTGVSADDNVQYFLRVSDSTEVRAILYSDGDWYNHDGTYGTISDVKLKQDIVDTRSYWDDFKAIKYRKYRHKSDVEADSEAPYRLGLVAQEVEAIFPSLVASTPDRETQLVPVIGEDGNPVMEDMADENGEVVSTPKMESKVVDLGTVTKMVRSSIIEGPIMGSVVQEAMARIETLEAQVAALQGA